MSAEKLNEGALVSSSIRIVIFTTKNRSEI